MSSRIAELEFGDSRLNRQKLSFVYLVVVVVVVVVVVLVVVVALVVVGGRSHCMSRRVVVGRYRCRRCRRRCRRCGLRLALGDLDWRQQNRHFALICNVENRLDSCRDVDNRSV